MAFSKVFVRKTFCKLLSKYLCWRLFLVKFYAFSMFFWIALASGLWKTFFERRLILDIQTTFVSLQKLLIKYIKNKSCKFYLGNKKQKVLFPVASWSDVHFAFAHPFFACPMLWKIGWDETSLSRSERASNNSLEIAEFLMPDVQNVLQSSGFQKVIKKAL